MMKYFRLTTILLVFAFTAGALISPHSASAASAAELDRDAQKALGDLYVKSSLAKTMGEKAIGILVFPAIVKGGFIVGGQYGEGALIKDGKAVAYYNTIAASYGLQAGLQKFGYALFFMTDSALKWLDKSDGWEIGVGPSIVVVDAGAAASMTSTTLQSDIYAFFFDQKGLMAGIGLQGTKITKLGKTPPSD
ncbi:MAG: twin-arginine translocation pathway signal protein [Deltaproteobacteria bacterium]|nr:MAG: twin-arginine translocation pathway signal protein [Deltaproteobacteria bacterium]